MKLSRRTLTVNAAFKKLPPGVGEMLLKPENVVRY
jgi:hypothetical protein